MDKSLPRQYYSRFEIQRAILRFAKNREIGSRFDGYFGKRPDVIEYISDVRSLVRAGIFSFHASEERWENPLLLGDVSLSEVERNKNKVGWDLILDLDGLDFEYSKLVGVIIVDFLMELGIRNISVKFSGNKGFHIGIPFEAFSQEIIGIGKTRLLFPEVARKIAAYLINELKGKFSKALIEYEGSIENISKKHNIAIKDLEIDDVDSMNFNYMKFIEIDTILISSRHLFRMPYSLNEKSGLVSIPIKTQRIAEFEKDEAVPENVDPQKYEDFDFLRYDSSFGKDADVLLRRTYEDENEVDFEHIQKRYLQEKKGTERGIIFTGDSDTEVFDIDEEVELKDFPLTLQYVLNNKFEDGKKRALFLLLTFFHSIKWDEEHIEERVLNWNNLQVSPLKKSYIMAQINWFKNQEKIISPPNFNNENYFKGIGVPKELIEKDKTRFKSILIRNPLHYVFVLIKKRTKKT